jgi:hypothetical protein
MEYARVDGYAVLKWYLNGLCLETSLRDAVSWGGMHLRS